MSISRFSFPTQIFLGAGVRSQVVEHLKSNGFKKPLYVTDRGVAKLGWYQSLLSDAKSGSLEPASFSEIWGNPVKSQVMAGVEAFRSHRADCVVGIGGGAALDVAKAIITMVNHPGDLFDYEDDLPGARPFDQAVPYWIALPTTAGTGSEVGRSAVISDDKTHIKKIIFSPKLLAKAVFADPELTFDLPAPITAATGLDALTHNVEAYLAKNYHPLCDGIALEGVRLAAEHLVNAVRSPKNIEARTGMLMSSMMGAIAFQKGLGIVHSCAHALGTVVDMHHGLANGIMIDHALKHNINVSKDRFITMARAIRLKDETPNGFIQWLGSLKSELSIPAKLSGAGVKKESLAALVEVATKDSCHMNNPVTVSAEDFKRIFAEAL